ncbi:rhodanese-like domain-containing protein [Psychrosphaera sp. B3R10]|uniref:Rhodanese-like domain-containing protein n=1 Tax=Psychrosphaera algicola TaxID=3023714 RepID=A0ABT5F8B2_9GAMM|nr:MULTISPECIES: rhodanese-like domain-containing protein [unclassified Psychrosphaera]MBU2882167.1 rhodanese-like domain-containing protein [Psychrosphaera sp. I2R16]MBU2988848.1 rhodanese-like domain-containing protein [Psychrosphaera sp. B3R10]MDC2887778.1 rhodanese-like domain-containing protein [Psychrosphaera sp. G1-22]MDO6717868.1 rhodanese-like domain-containing protein [Psychrosphaera sp. 1_MG-2023]
MLTSIGDIVANVKQEIREISVADFKEILNKNTVVIDVREPSEYSLGHIESAVNYPRGVLEMQITQHPSVKDLADPMLGLADQDIYLICRSGARSALAAESLNRMGLDAVYSVAGGMVAWEQQAS